MKRMSNPVAGDDVPNPGIQQSNSTSVVVAPNECTSVGGKSFCDNGCTEKQQRCCIGLVVMVSMAVTLVAGTELTQGTYDGGNSFAPFFVMYFWTAWPILFHPGYLLIERSCSNGEFSLKQSLSDSLHMYKPYDFRIGHLIWKTAVFCVLWNITNYAFIRALHLLDAMDVIALFATNQSFVYMLSWIMLFHQFVALRIIAMIFSITGIVLFTYADGFGTPSMWGVVIAVASSASASIYKVLYKKCVGDVGFAQRSMFLSLIGLVSLITLWPIVIILHFTNTEIITASFPWGHLCGSSILLLVFQFFSSFMDVFTNSTVMGLGVMLGIPLSAVADYVWNDREIHGMKLSAVVLIAFSLMLLLLPDNFPDRVWQLCTKCIHKDIEPPSFRDRRNKIGRTGR